MKLIVQAISKRNVVEAEWEIDTDNSIIPKTFPVPVFAENLPQRAARIQVWRKPD